MKRVILESPYAGDVEANVAYARRAMADCLKRGEAPFASHLLYPQVLNDNKQSERANGITAGFMWCNKADKCVVYTDRGISAGMQRGIEYASAIRIPVEFRSLGSAA